MTYAPLGKIKTLTVHCAATPEGRDNTAEQVNAWDIQRFGQISYHQVVELDGRTVRGLLDTQKGAHTGMHNTGNIGICYVGGTTTLNAGAKPKDTRTVAQKRALKSLIQEYQKKYPGIVVLGHRDWPGVSKACPSFSVKPWVKAGMPE